MRSLYKSGTVQKIVERILAIAVQFDDDQELDVWVYDHEFSRLGQITEQDFAGYVDREILGNEQLHKFGRNNEPPVMKDVLKKYVDEEPSSQPAFIIFINDGGCKKTIEPIIVGSSNKPVFWQFVGIGNGNFDFLKKLDTLKGRFIDNANFLHIKDIDKISNDQLYDLLLTEFPMWLKEAKKKGVLTNEEIGLVEKKPQKKKGFWSSLFK